MDIKSVVKAGKVKYGLVLRWGFCCVIISRDCIILTELTTTVIRHIIILDEAGMLDQSAAVWTGETH